MSTILSCTTPRAAKVHLCDWCGLRIVPGESYRRTVHITEGELFVWKEHHHCQEVARRLGVESDECAADCFRDAVCDYAVDHVAGYPVDYTKKSWAEVYSRVCEHVLMAPGEGKEG